MVALELADEQRSSGGGRDQRGSASSCSYERNDRSGEIREVYYRLRDAGVPERESEVGARLMFERNRREIAAELGISPSTVDSYRQRLEERISVAERFLEAVDAGEQRP